MPRIVVDVMPKPEILDPQGKAILGALNRLGQTGWVALLPALQLSRAVRHRSLDAVAQFQAGMAELERAIGAPLP